MSNKKLDIAQVASMTSLEISNIVDLRHDNVKRTIETLAKQGVINLPQNEEGSIIRSNGRKMKTSCFRFSGEQGKRDCIIVVAQLSPKVTATIVDRWMELEVAYANLLKRVNARKDSKSLFRGMTDTVKAVREAEGKAIKFYHFSNEADMLNTIIFGMKAKAYRESQGFSPDVPMRDYMTKEELAAINGLQSANKELYRAGLSMEERKPLLMKIFKRDYEPALIASVTETDRLA